jgi:hypothetical protein
MKAAAKAGMPMKISWQPVTANNMAISAINENNQRSNNINQRRNVIWPIMAASISGVAAKIIWLA